MRFFKEYYSLLAASVGRILPEKKMPDEQPLRAELFSVDQFKLHAEHIARTHQVRFKPGREKLLSRLKENEKILLRAYDLLNDAGKAKRRISPAGEWLLDNYYLVEEHIRLAKQYLPKGYSRELPHLTRGPLAGCPRVYDIAMEMVSHGDGRVDLRGLAGFVSAYQSVSHLKIGELWAIPIMMRLALIENLRRVSARMVSAQRDRDKADYWASRIMEVPGKDANGVLLEIGAMASAGLALTSSFVAEFVRRLHGQSSTLNLPLIWLEKALSEHGENIDRLIQLTNRNQAADQVSIANTIGSLRLLQVTDWHDFVEEMSIVDATLRRDPSGDYRMMSFDTRDRYRHVIEMLAMRSGCTEEYAALKAVELAEEAKVSNGPDDVSAHVGYYLIDGGMPRLYRLLGLRLFVSEYIQAQRTTLPFALYTGAIAGTTCLASAGALFLAWHLGVRDGAALAVLGVLLLISASQPAVALVNWLATVLVLPQRLPKMDFSEGIPAHAHTLVAVPAMLCDARVVESLIENLEVRYLANVDANVDFALLTDFCDAAHETMPDDDAVLGQAKAGIEKLNHKYRRHKDGIFYLLHRRRRWNQREGVWMGYERKRGKLGALNAFLRGRAPDAFSDIVGDPSRLQDVKYVITLDTDTRMPRDVARDMAGIIAHPLNRPVYDEKKKRVTAGYGILQPRVEVSYPGDNPSLFVKVYGGESGIDPYTKTVSDVYQDLFHEGSFIGKGLYDVDAVERSLAGRFPDNLILSHDLLEGCYARSALVSDVQLYEAYPSAYLKDVYRRHRWIRGDWQIARWIFPFVPGPGGTRVNNPLSVLSRWKILDNLRRSLVPVSTSLLFPAGWFFMSPSGAWTAMAVLFIALPPLLMSLVGIARKPRESLLRAHLYAAVYGFGLHAVQCFFSLIFILYESFVSINAIATTFWRMLISRRRLLEWSESGESDLNFPKTLPGYVKKMSLPALTSLVVVCLAPLYLHADALAVMVAAMWLFSPAAAYLISRPSAARTVRLSAEQVLFLRRFSRKAWSFFETFVGERDNWLPPDNFQEEPRGAVAHRTSPTNIGLSLLSNLAAYDFGYVSMGRMFNRTEKTLTTMNRMAKFRGHLYNWYDTESLQPMEPLYISSVDSGNLVGHLLVLRSGLTELADKKIVSLKIFDGLSDTLHVLGECVTEAAHNTGGAAAEAGKKAAEKIDRLNNKIESPPALLSEIHALLRQLPADVANIVAGLDQIQYEHASKWGRAFENQCLDHLEDIAFIAPWVLLPPEIPGMWDTGDDRHKERLARLREELRRLDEIPVLGAVARLEMKLIALIDEILEHAIPSGGTARDEEWFMKLREAIKDAGTRSSERISAVDYIVLQCTELSSVEYEFLYDRVLRLLSIGFNVKERLADPSCYDLLASEARLCSFVAIAQGRMPQDHWFMLGRMLSTHGGDPVLVSWGGSMFEYLMPLLVMPTYEGTLLDRTYRAAISRQIDYASRNNIPWGISESGYNKIDSTTTYQYRSFGVPDTGFKRGLSEDLVVAPYASTLALMVEPEKACENLQQLHESGFGGEYGFYEAIDYTPSRLAHGESHAIVKSFMAHHQGMSFLSLAHLLLGRPMQRRFLADPMFKATELLLQERVPKEVPFLYDIEVTGLLRKVEERESLLRVFTTPHTATPEIYLLSNGRYIVMVTNAGGGYSHWKKLAVTRWQEDSSLDNAGSFIYLRDIESGNFWSTAYQPTLNTPRSYQAIFSQSRAEFKRRDYRIDTHTNSSLSRRRYRTAQGQDHEHVKPEAFH